MLSPRPVRLALAIIPVLALSGCAKEIVVHEQTEADANRILYLLSVEGIDALKIKDAESREVRFNIQVAKEDEVRTLGVLHKHNLPEEKKDGTSELFKEGGLIPTSAAERAKREVGVAGDIVNSLRSIPRIVSASALVSIPEDNPLRDVNEAKPKPKASVLVSYLPDEKNNPPLGVEDVQRFIQASLPELRSSEVSVQLIATGERMASAASAAGDAAGAVLGANACEKVRVIGIDVCNGHQGRLRNSLIGVVVVAGLLAGMVVLSVLRALRYRKDLTRLTAQVAQLKPR